jgi:hypothetical protein
MCRFARSSRIAAIVGTPDFLISGPFDREEMLEHVMEGKSIGAAVVAGAQGRPLAGQHRFVVVGDPEFTPSLAVGFDLERVVNSDGDGTVEGTGGVAVKVALQCASNAAKLEEALDELAAAGWARLVDRVVQSYAALDPVAKEPCDCCAAPARLFLAHGGAEPRSLQFCIRCGPTSCWPARRSRPLLKIREGRICLAGYDPQGVWRGRMYLWGFRAQDHNVEEWPADANGLPLSELAFPAGLARHRRLGALFLDSDWSLLCYPQEFAGDESRGSTAGSNRAEERCGRSARPAAH